MYSAWYCKLIPQSYSEAVFTNSATEFSPGCKYECFKQPLQRNYYRFIVYYRYARFSVGPIRNFYIDVRRGFNFQQSNLSDAIGPLWFQLHNSRRWR